MASNGRFPKQEAARQAALIRNDSTRRLVEKSLLNGASMNTMVRAFHQLYELPVIDPPKAKMNFGHITKERLAMRFGLIVEEFMELCEAMDIRADINFYYEDEEGDFQAVDKVLTAENHNFIADRELHELARERAYKAIVETDERSLPDIADATFDLKYVIIGFEYEVGIDPQFCAEEGHAANMTKLGQKGEVLRREDGKVMKGPNFIRPDMARALKAWGMRDV